MYNLYNCSSKGIEWNGKDKEYTHLIKQKRERILWSIKLSVHIYTANSRIIQTGFHYIMNICAIE